MHLVAGLLVVSCKSNGPTVQENALDLCVAEDRQLFHQQELKVDKGSIVCVGTQEDHLYILWNIWDKLADNYYGVVYKYSCKYGEVSVENKTRLAGSTDGDTHWKWNSANSIFYSYPESFSRIGIDGTVINTPDCMRKYRYENEGAMGPNTIAYTWSEKFGHVFAQGPRLYTDDTKGSGGSKVKLFRVNEKTGETKSVEIGPIQYGAYGNSTIWWQGDVVDTEEQTIFFLPGGNVWRWKRGTSEVEEVELWHYGLEYWDDDWRLSFDYTNAFVTADGKTIGAWRDNIDLFIISGDTISCVSTPGSDSGTYITVGHDPESPSAVWLMGWSDLNGKIGRSISKIDFQLGAIEEKQISTTTLGKAAIGGGIVGDYIISINENGLAHIYRFRN